jgi:formylglycine-generating enzyme required for sulfatase activity
MFCNHCGARNADGSSFCSACGKTITSPSLGGPAAPATELGLPAGFILANRYRILGELGIGGMGRVYLAEDQRLEAKVAIKVLREMLSRDSGSVKRLITEAKLSIQLSHPNVVRVNHFEDGEMVKFLVMEYIEGQTLADYIANKEKLPEEEARHIGIEICKGLEHAHTKKVIHRDIKPGNILLAKNGEIKIADFGIARECRDSMSRLTSQIDSGTLLYMSPEQLVGRSNEASDVYSLGVVLYEMLQGRPPFRSGDITYQIREMDPEPLAGVTSELSTIILKCLEKKPELRCPSVRVMREELEGTSQARQMEKECRAEESRRQEEEKRKAEEARQQADLEAKRQAEEVRLAQVRKAEKEQQRQAEIEANRHNQEETRRREKARKAASSLTTISIAMLDRGAFDDAHARLQEALRLDPQNADAQAALARCLAEKTPAEESARHAQSQKTARVAAKPKYGRNAVIGVLAVGIIAVSIWIVTSMGSKQQGSPSAGPAIEPPNSSPVDKKTRSSPINEIEFASIPAGKFMMGCSADDNDCSPNEKPRHEVTISQGFEMGKYEVTQGQWTGMMDNNPSHFTGNDRLPVERVSWNDAQAFITKLNALNDGYRYRLPTEAEWEYAARAGTNGSCYGNLSAIAWYKANSGGETKSVGQKQPNGFGLYDILGNVWEWCSDGYWESYYGHSSAIDPRYPSSGPYRIVRGGSWDLDEHWLRVSDRGWDPPDGKHGNFGLRVCRQKQ